MRFLIALLFIGVITVGTVEFGVWIMKGMLDRSAEHHASRAPIARVVGYIIGAIALVAFLSLATGASSWVVSGLLVAIPIAIVLAYWKPVRSS
jgi:small-conductance mechanosensitive channel